MRSAVLSTLLAVSAAFMSVPASADTHLTPFLFDQENLVINLPPAACQIQSMDAGGQIVSNYAFAPQQGGQPLPAINFSVVRYSVVISAADQQRALEGAAQQQQQAVAGMGGQMTDNVAITLGGNPGREMLFKTAEGAYLVRTYFIGNAQVMVNTVIPPAQSDKMSLYADIFGSLRLRGANEAIQNAITCAPAQ